MLLDTVIFRIWCKKVVSVYRNSHFATCFTYLWCKLKSLKYGIGFFWMKSVMECIRKIHVNNCVWYKIVIDILTTVVCLSVIHDFIAILYRENDLPKKMSLFENRMKKYLSHMMVTTPLTLCFVISTVHLNVEDLKSQVTGSSSSLASSASSTDTKTDTSKEKDRERGHSR